MKVLVLDGNENQAVAAVRALHARGHKVVVGADSSWSKAGWSRAASGTFIYPAPQRNMDAFVERLIAELHQSRDTLVLPMTERTTIPVSKRRDEIIRAGGLLVLPAHEMVMRALNKRQTTELARSIGITVPVTIPFSSRAEAEGVAESQRYPVVLKAQASEEVSADGRVLSTGAPRYARNADEFLSAYNEMSCRCSSFLAQEFVAGIGTGYFALMHHGELRAEFAHRRIRDVRPTGSGSAVRRSIEPDVHMRNSALNLLRELQWHGVAMVEFRRRPDGTQVFMEVNGRFWNSLALAIYSGVDFPSLLASMAEHGDVEPQRSYRTGVRCRWFLGDLRHLLEVWRGAPKAYPARYPNRWCALLDFLTPVAGTRHDNFIWKDPLPEVGDWLDFVAHRLPERNRERTTEQSKLNVENRYSLS